MADESCCNEKDYQKICQVAHAVNIKTEKAGGLRSSLRAALKAKQLGLEVMFGIMVTTKLGCAQTFQLHPLARYMDIDGDLLVKDPIVEGGFKWGKEGKIDPWPEGCGLQVNSSVIFD